MGSAVSHYYYFIAESNMTIRVLISGHLGKMGILSKQALDELTDVQVVGFHEKEQSLSTTIQDCKPNVVLDFTVPQVVDEHLRVILEHQCSPIIGTSGLSDQAIKQAQAICDQNMLGGLIVPNFSIGMCLLMHCAKQVAPHFTSREIVEMHHPKKKDAPSGTAVALAKNLASCESRYTHDSQEIYAGALGTKVAGTPIHAMRMPGCLADMSVHFSNVEENLILSHRTVSRTSFIPGIQLACRQVRSLNTLKIGLDHLLGLATDVNGSDML